MARTVPVVSSPQAKIQSGVRVTTAEIDSCKGTQEKENEDKREKGREEEMQKFGDKWVRKVRKTDDKGKQNTEGEVVHKKKKRGDGKRNRQNERRRNWK